MAGGHDFLCSEEGRGFKIKIKRFVGLIEGLVMIETNVGKLVVVRGEKCKAEEEIAGTESFILGGKCQKCSASKPQKGQICSPDSDAARSCGLGTMM